MINPKSYNIAVEALDKITKNSQPNIAYSIARGALIEIEKLPQGSPEVRCEGCGSTWTDEEINEGKVTRGILSCCPERKPLDIDQWREKADKLEAENAKLRDVLKQHHEWHLNSGGIAFKDETTGEWIELNNAAEYCDSQLYEDTAKHFDSERKGVSIDHSKQYDIFHLQKLSDAAQGGDWYADDITPWILGEESDDDPHKFKQVARSPCFRKVDTDLRRQWMHDRLFIVACVKYVRNIVLKSKYHARNIFNDQDWLRLADILGMTQYSHGWKAPSIDHLLNTVRNREAERNRLRQEKFEDANVEAGKKAD